MIKRIKPNIVGSILVVFSLFFLYCSAAYAEKRVKQSPQIACDQAIAVIKIDSYTTNVSNNFAYPSMTSEVFNQYQAINTLSSSKTFTQPMQGIQVADFSHLVPGKFDKKISFFEFAAKFNDKLQQVIAFFDFSSADTESKDENVSDIAHKRKVRFDAKNDKVSIKIKCSNSKS